MKFFHQLISTFFFIGKMPFAPGTWGSFAGAMVYWLLPSDSFQIQVVLLVLALIIGTWSAHQYSKNISIKDPSEVVIDEVAGIWLSLIFLPKEIIWFLSAFILFRILDIYKPFIINRVQHIKGGMGIMLDDILAGILTRLILAVVYSF